MKETGSPKLLFENLDLSPIQPILWRGLHQEGPGRPVKYNPESDLKALILRQLEQIPYIKDLVNNALMFLAKKLLKYIRGFLMQPMKALKLWFQLERPGRLRDELISEIFQAAKTLPQKKTGIPIFSRLKGRA